MLLERLAHYLTDHRYQPQEYRGDQAWHCYRGDHQLNPGMAPARKAGAGLLAAAVLVPVIRRGDRSMILFTRRAAHLTHHPGQISFPGGRQETQDRGPIATALRETEEEVGVPASNIEVLGYLDDYLTRTGFVVTPVVGLIEAPYVAEPDSNEVAEVFEVPLSYLMDPCNHRRYATVVRGQRGNFHAIPYRHYFIWGATAGIIMNLYQLLHGGR